MRQTLTAEQRGYGARHRQIRREMKKLVDPVARSVAVWTVDPSGEPWHAGHETTCRAPRLAASTQVPNMRNVRRISGGWKRQGYHPTPAPRSTGPRPKALGFFDPKPDDSQSITDAADE